MLEDLYSKSFTACCQSRQWANRMVSSQRWSTRMWSIALSICLTPTGSDANGITCTTSWL